MEFVDISQKLKDEVAKLGMGEMVTSSEFALEEAMSSIELMEPKMDPGFLHEEKKIVSDSTREEIRNADLSDSDQCRIADILLGEVLNWINGHLYIQTVHSSFFMIERDLLRCVGLSHYCNELLSLCNDIREFVSMTGVCADEDFVSFMFHTFEGAAEPSLEKAPVVVSPGLRLRFEFLSRLRAIMVEVGSPDPITRFTSLTNICDDILGNISPVDDIGIIEKSVDRTFHKDLLPAGPPRVVPPVASSESIYSDWRSIGETLIKVSVFSESESSNPIQVLQLLDQSRTVFGFSNCFVRTTLYHRMYRTLKANQLVSDWVETCIGGTAESVVGKKNMTEWKPFMDDLVSVFGRCVHTLCRSPSRQHRNMDAVLADLCIMQHRAWDLHLKAQKNRRTESTKGIWNAVAWMATTMIAFHLTLSIRLDLVDLQTEEIGVVFYLLKHCLNIRLIALDDVLSLDPKNKAVRDDIISTAAEHATAVAILSTLASLKPVPALSDDLRFMFALRSKPLRAFPLPKELTAEDYLKERSTSTNPTAAFDDALAWVQRITGTGASPLLNGDIAGLKRTLLHNKLFFVRKGDGGVKFELKYNPLVPCVVSTE
jgi:hypothetical protein